MSQKLALVLILSSVALIFIVQNFAVVEISFLYWRVSMSSALLIFFTLITGFVLGWLFHSHQLHQKSRGESVYFH